MSAAWSRAVIITPSAAGADGVSAVTRLYAQALAAQLGAGLASLEIWSLAGGSPMAIAEDPRVTVRSADGNRLRFAAFGLAIAGAGPGTLVVVQHVHLLPVALPLAWRGARVVLLLHGVEAWKRLRPLERAGCRAAWKIAAVSAHTAERFRLANPDLADRAVEVCAPGVTASAVSAAAPSSGRYALIVGRMAADERYKGHDTLIDLWPAVRSAVPDAQLVIVGAGDDKARLVEKVATLGLEQAIRFEGIVGEARLAELYRGATIFVMPSPNEGFGLVFAEAMLAGIPCIAASGAAEEIVEHGATGVVVPPGDRAALERAIVRLLTSREERDRMGAAAAASAQRRFSTKAFATRVYHLLQFPEAGAAC